MLRALLVGAVLVVGFSVVLGWSQVQAPDDSAAAVAVAPGDTLPAASLRLLPRKLDRALVVELECAGGGVAAATLTMDEAATLAGALLAEREKILRGGFPQSALRPSVVCR